jgi:hypothetical protein
LQPAEEGVAAAEDFTFCFAQGGAAFDSFLIAGAEELVERFYEVKGLLGARLSEFVAHRTPFLG